MDKEIIIDGVDISECKQYIDADNDDLCSKQSTGYDLHYDKCANYPNCYHKQLKRKEQECEKLKQVANDSIIEQEKLIAKVNELQAENKQLKKLKFKSDGIELLQDANLNLHKANVKYRQALQEIRDIAGSIIGNANATYTGFYNKLSDILDKINEVIGAEE